jgi:hypothetical protein
MHITLKDAQPRVVRLDSLEPGTKFKYPGYQDIFTVCAASASVSPRSGCVMIMVDFVVTETAGTDQVIPINAKEEKQFTVPAKNIPVGSCFMRRDISGKGNNKILMRISEISRPTIQWHQPAMWHHSAYNPLIRVTTLQGSVNTATATDDMLIGPKSGSGYDGYVNPDSLASSWSMHVVDYVDLETGSTHFVQETEAVIPLIVKADAELTTDPDKK